MSKPASSQLLLLQLAHNAQITNTLRLLASGIAHTAIAEPQLNRHILTHCASSSHQSLPIVHLTEVLAINLQLAFATCINQLLWSL